jgi:hypothetical protein
VTLPRVALLVLGDGRRELQAATLKSWRAQARHYDLTRLTIVDDSHHLLGFCGAIRYGWQRLLEDGPSFDYVFHLEEDWRFDCEFSIAHMTRLLDTEPQVCQVALRRGAEPAEQGAIIERFPHEFTDRAIGMLGLGQPARTQEWLEHRLFWTTNPGVYRRQLIEAYEWPEPPRCEARFGETLISEGGTFAYWGDRHDDPWITHTGTQRTGHGY